MSDEAYSALLKLKDENYEKIYGNSNVDGYCDEDLQNTVDDVFRLIYDDTKESCKIIDKYYRPYIYPNKDRVDEYIEENLKHPERLAIDMIAGMSDKYLLEFHEKHGKK